MHSVHTARTMPNPTVSVKFINHNNDVRIKTHNISLQTIAACRRTRCGPHDKHIFPHALHHPAHGADVQHLCVRHPGGILAQPAGNGERAPRQRHTGGATECERYEQHCDASTPNDIRADLLLWQSFQFGPRYDWSPYEQSLLLGAFHYTYPLAHIPSGLLLDRFALGRQYVLVTFAVAGVVVLLGPLAAGSGANSFGWLFGQRLLLGLLQGGTFPNIQRLISRWAPRSELGLFALANHGSNLGTVLACIVSATIVERAGWQWSFYAIGILLSVFLMLWWWNVYDTPAGHPRIGKAERAYIERSVPVVGQKVSVILVVL